MKVVVFGNRDLAELAHYYLTHDSEHEVVAFCVNESYLNGESEYCGLPLCAFEQVESIYPPAEYAFFAPMTASNINHDRERTYLAIKAKGYRMISYVSSKATVCHNQIGDNCFILEDNTLQPFTNIGNNVVMWSGNHIGHHGSVGDHCFFTSHVVMSGHCHIESHCFFGVNASLRDGLRIAQGTVVSMGANVLADTEAWGVYVGNPAKKIERSSKSLKL
jgi:sugar O-acyltransferase (sialic acid O-acetyltransferase NeuD family)